MTIIIFVSLSLLIFNYETGCVNKSERSDPYPNKKGQKRAIGIWI